MYILDEYAVQEFNRRNTQNKLYKKNKSYN